MRLALGNRSGIKIAPRRQHVIGVAQLKGVIECGAGLNPGLLGSDLHDRASAFLLWTCDGHRRSFDEDGLHLRLLDLFRLLGFTIAALLTFGHEGLLGLHRLMPG